MPVIAAAAIMLAGAMQAWWQRQSNTARAHAARRDGGGREFDARGAEPENPAEPAPADEPYAPASWAISSAQASACSWARLTSSGLQPIARAWQAIASKSRCSEASVSARKGE